MLAQHLIAGRCSRPSSAAMTSPRTIRRPDHGTDAGRPRRAQPRRREPPPRSSTTRPHARQGVDTAEGRQKLDRPALRHLFRHRLQEDRRQARHRLHRSRSSTSSSARPTTCCESISARASPTRRPHLDGFVGTGTFITRLLQLGLIEPKDLARKYAHELHANEILLLAYYIAAVNIETTLPGPARRARRSRRPRALPRTDPHRHLPVLGGRRSP